MKLTLISIRLEDHGDYWRHDVMRMAPDPKGRASGDAPNREAAAEEALSNARFLLDLGGKT